MNGGDDDDDSKVLRTATVTNATWLNVWPKVYIRYDYYRWRRPEWMKTFNED